MPKITPDQRAALDALRRYLKPGDTLYNIVKHVSRSGMQRSIAAYAMVDGEPLWLSGYIALAGIATFDKNHDANRMHGCGMNMCFWLTYEVSRALWPDGFGCIGDTIFEHARTVPPLVSGQRCPSNDHTNGDRDYTPHACSKECRDCHADFHHWHRDGGYALRSRSL